MVATHAETCTQAMAGGGGVKLISISAPPIEFTGNCYPKSSGVYSQSNPDGIDRSLGIGNLVNLDSTGTFTLHDHVYSSPSIPDPMRSTIIYKFSQSVSVDLIRTRQHVNGIDQIEVYYGDDENSLTSLGVITSPLGLNVHAAEFQIVDF